MCNPTDRSTSDGMKRERCGMGRGDRARLRHEKLLSEPSGTTAAATLRNDDDVQRCLLLARHATTTRQAADRPYDHCTPLSISLRLPNIPLPFLLRAFSPSLSYRFASSSASLFRRAPLFPRAFPPRAVSLRLPFSLFSLSNPLATNIG